MATKDELLNKCLEGSITQKDLPSYNQTSSSAKNVAGNSEVNKSIAEGIQYLNYELNSKTEKNDGE